MAARAAGFTLVELMVAMAIVAIGLVIAVPILSDPSPGTRVKAAAHQLVAALRETRSEAVLRNIETVLTLDVEGRAFRTLPALRQKALPRDVELTMTTADSERVSESAANIRFFPDGSSTGGRITLTKGPTTYQVTIPWLTGRARVDEPAASR